MTSMLARIQSDVQKYIEAIAGLIDCEVEVVDASMIRIAATGAYRRQIDDNISGQGYVYRHALQEKRTILVDNPGRNSLCALCDNRLNCREMLDLATPVALDGVVIGVIGIICSTREQRDNLLAQRDKYVMFIEQVAHLVAGKAYEFRERQREKDTLAVFKKMIETMSNGVVALDGDGVVWQANLSAARILRSKELIGRRIVLEASGDVVYDLEEAWLIVDGEKFHVLCTRMALSTVELGDVALIVFQDAADYAVDPGASSRKALSPDRLTGDSPAIRRVKADIERVAAGHANVLIAGESGTGKEVVASEIHRKSKRRDGPYVTINCASIPEQLLESELFGYVKGAFSGADPKGRIGKFEQASGGTIFLDEIGDMPVYLQAKLLRILQDRIVTRVGSNQAIPIDVRLITATNKNLADLIGKGQFREDLYYRINVIELSLPSLRDRREDIAALTHHFLDEFAATYGRSAQRLPEKVANAFYFYGWPGNVRELRNAVEHMFVMRGESREFTIAHLPRTIRQCAPAHKAKPPSPSALDTMQQARQIQSLLNKHGWTLPGKRQAAAELGIGIATLYRKLKKFNIENR